MRIKKFHTMLGLLLFCLGSCTKSNNIALISDYKDGIWFYKDATNYVWNGIDSATLKATIISKFADSLNFYYMGDSVTSDTLVLPSIRIMGNIANYDREIKMEAVKDSGNAVEGRDFKFIKNVIPAGQTMVSPVIQLLRTTAIKDTTLKLVIRLDSSADFPAVIASDTLSKDQTFLISRTTHVLIKDIFAKPPYWTDLRYFGTWSKAKSLFMKNLFGFDLGLEPVTSDDYPQLYNYYLTLKSAFNAYVTKYGYEPFSF